MTNNYEDKRNALIASLTSRIAKLRAFAKTNDLSLYSEEKSGIPLGQPILVGHHSERRHRRHLERIENKVRKGFDAAKLADRLQTRLDNMVNSRIIQVDNPDAADLIKAKISKLENLVAQWKRVNALIRKSKGVEADLDVLLQKEYGPACQLKASTLLTPDFAGRRGYPSYQLTNTGAEIRRLKGRLVELERISEGFTSYAVGLVTVELIDGQIQVEFPDKPSDECRERLKRSPLALKWSSYSKRWVRKHTATTAGRYFQTELKNTLEQFYGTNKG